MTPGDKLAAVIAEITEIGEKQAGTVMCRSVINRLQPILAELQQAQGREHVPLITFARCSCSWEWSLDSKDGTYEQWYEHICGEGK